MYGRSNGVRASARRITLPPELPDTFERTRRSEFIDGVREAASPPRRAVVYLDRAGELLFCHSGAV